MNISEHINTVGKNRLIDFSQLSNLSYIKIVSIISYEDNLLNSSKKSLCHLLPSFEMYFIFFALTANIKVLRVDKIDVIKVKI